MNAMTLQEKLLSALSVEDYGQVRALLGELHPSEIADLLESLPPKVRETLWDLIEPALEGDVLSEIQDAVRSSLLEQMHPKEVAEATKDLDTDDAADILQDLPEDVVASVLDSMDAQNRERVASILSYPEDDAGGLMNIDVVPIRADVSLDVVSRYLRQLGELPEQTDNLMVVDRENLYLGVLPLADILTKKPDTSVGENMIKETGITADTPAQEVARIFEQRDWFSAGVVDEQGTLLGRITVDDVVDVIEEEAEEDLMLMSGIRETDIAESVFEASKNRVIWLIINLATAILASMVIALFDASIQQMVALAVLMPIVASMGGNAGTQTLTVTVRAIATRELTSSNVKRIVFREFSIALVNGIILALIIGVLAWLWFDNMALGGVMGTAMVVNIIMAGLAGILIPIFLDKMDIDPALASSIFVTTITDVIGFFSFLGLAAVVLL